MFVDAQRSQAAPAVLEMDRRLTLIVIKKWGTCDSRRRPSKRILVEMEG